MAGRVIFCLPLYQKSELIFFLLYCFSFGNLFPIFPGSCSGLTFLLLYIRHDRLPFYIIINRPGVAGSVL